ncbi:MAG: hypothetical protein M3N31_08455 [Actinomycetota bacterium]|nr:hypothetical protein [Actinomycetota bacterium]
MRARHRVVMAGVALAVWVGAPTAAWAVHCPPGSYGCVHGIDEVRPPDNFGSTPTDPGGSGVGSAGTARTGVGSAGTHGTNGTNGTDGTDGTNGTDGNNGLPVTGGDIVGLTVMGLGALGVGTVLVRRSRRPVPAS